MTLIESMLSLILLLLRTWIRWICAAKDSSSLRGKIVDLSVDNTDQMGQRMTTSMISHLVIVPDDTRVRPTTFFQGFSDFWYPDYLAILKVLTQFPHDLGDIYFTGREYVLTKAMGSPLQIQTLRADLVKQYLSDCETRPLIVWSTALTVDVVKSAIGQKPITHISTAPQDGVIHVDSLNHDAILALISGIVDALAEEHDEFKEFKKFVERKRGEATQETLTVNAKGHNCTEPMLDVLLSYGVQIDVTPIKPAGETTEHITGMIELGALIDGLRPEQINTSPLRKNDVIIHCPSVYTYLYRADSAHWQQLNRKLNNPKRNFLRRVLIRSCGYGNSTLQIAEKDIFNPYEDPILGPLLYDRQIELRLFTTAIALVAVNQFAPAFRLPNDVMLHHDKLRDIGKLLCSNDRKWREKLNTRMQEYGQLLKTEIGDALLASIFSEREKILAVCDFPVEWMPVNQLPIMFRYELSRIPSTPGNVALFVLTSRPKSMFRYSDLCNILIIRSFADNDPIKDHLSDIVQAREQAQRLPGMNILIVDVKTRQEIVDALNAFTGLMVIFDCHGGHGGETDSAWLAIGDEKLSVWHIYQEARIPPIIVLAACSTHPAEGSHASVANGFLESGAFSVIGTFAPVDSSHTAVFVTRLLERIAIYLPLALKRRAYSWREVVTGLLRMSYVRDVLEGLRDRLGLLNQQQYEKIHIQANMLINTHEDKNWFEHFRSLISDETGLDKDTETKLWDEHFQFVETMLFVQLGRPENVMIAIEGE